MTFLVGSGWCIAQEASLDDASEVVFDEFFTNRALRFELFHAGDARRSTISLHEVYEEPIWPESPSSLKSPFPYGRCIAKFFDQSTGRLICKRPFDTMFAEYATTEPARNGIQRVFQTTVRCPMPKSTMRMVIEYRNPQYVYEPVFEKLIDPKDYHIRRETVALGDEVMDIHITGEPAKRVDVTFVAEGYTASEAAKFRSDVQRFTDYMFQQNPYRDLKDRFNIRGVFHASNESGTDEPRQGKYRSTVLQSTYNIFDLDRYLLVEENHLMHRIAAQTPYDTLVVLVNTKRYGGGAICLDYCVSSSDHETSPMVFLHEFGHSFAYLADEYIGNVAYSDMFPEGIEPVEPNITRQLQRDKIKWKALLTPDVPLPTPLQERELAKKNQWVGAFEGGGYLAKGMYRPEQACWMGSLDRDEGFCAVCADAIRRMIQLQSAP
jgi:hypothetical protein